MAWEKRERGDRYYTRSFRDGGRVRREYVGSGLAGELAALKDQIARDEREAEAFRAREEREAAGELLRLVGDVCREGDLLMKVSLLTAGYHRHHQGEWRKRRA